MDNAQRRIIKKNERSVFSRALHAKDDKDAIAAWKQEFNKILHIFNVRSVSSARHSLTESSQTELQIDVMVDVKGIRRDLSAIKEGALNQYHLVSTTCPHLAPPNRCLSPPRLKQGQ